MLFSGTLRHNLDPFEQYTEGRILEAAMSNLFVWYFESDVLLTVRTFTVLIEIPLGFSIENPRTKFPLGTPSCWTGGDGCSLPQKVGASDHRRRPTAKVSS